MLTTLLLIGCATESTSAGLPPVSPDATDPTWSEDGVVEMHFGSVSLPAGTTADLEELADRGSDITTLRTADDTAYELTWRFGDMGDAYETFKTAGFAVEPSDGGFGARVADDGGERCVYVSGADGVVLLQSRSVDPDVECPAFADTRADLASVADVEMTVEDLNPADATYGTYVGTYNGVNAYSNGSTSYVGPSGTYGIPYQCVEYVNRYFATYKGKANMKGTGNANAYCTGRPSGITVYTNGSATPPRVGDYLVSTGGAYGHVAIIREVGATYVKVIQQNWSNTTSDNSKTLTMTVSGGRYTISGFSTSYPVACWGR
jgi:surface antigen